jgi:hypothetical protein
MPWYDKYLTTVHRDGREIHNVGVRLLATLCVLAVLSPILILHCVLKALGRRGFTVVDGSSGKTHISISSESFFRKV